MQPRLRIGPEGDPGRPEGVEVMTAGGEAMFWRMEAERHTAPSQPTCEADGTRERDDGIEFYWNCAEPGVITVDGTLMCEDHAGALGYGPLQAEYGFDPDDGLNPTPERTEEG